MKMVQRTTLVKALIVASVSLVLVNGRPSYPSLLIPAGAITSVSDGRGISTTVIEGGQPIAAIPTMIGTIAAPGPIATTVLQAAVPAPGDEDDGSYKSNEAIDDNGSEGAAPGPIVTTVLQPAVLAASVEDDGSYKSNEAIDDNGNEGADTSANGSSGADDNGSSGDSGSDESSSGSGDDESKTEQSDEGQEATEPSVDESEAKPVVAAVPAAAAGPISTTVIEAAQPQPGLVVASGVPAQTVAAVPVHSAVVGSVPTSVSSQSSTVVHSAALVPAAVPTVAIVQPSSVVVQTNSIPAQVLTIPRLASVW